MATPTTLKPDQEAAYRSWMQGIGQTRQAGQNVGDDFSGGDYDYRGFFLKYGPKKIGKGEHFTDEFKLPNHATFSDESIYATGPDKDKAGHWNGDTFVPANAVSKTGTPLTDAANYTEMTQQPEQRRLAHIGVTAEPWESASLQQHIQAAAKAKAAGDMDAFKVIMERAVDAQHAQDRADPGMDPTSTMGTAAKLGAGLNAGIRSFGRHVGNLVPDALGGMTDQELARREELDKPLRDTGPGAVGAMVGEAGATAVPVLGAESAVANAAGRVGAPALRAMSSPLGRGASGGAIQGGVMGEPGSKAESMVTGAGFGMALPAAFAGAGKAMRGVTKTPEAEALLARGVELTPGQMNPKGFINQIEETATSLPGQGPMVKGAREAAEEGFVKAGTREAAAPGATIPDGDPRAMLDAAYQSFDPLYDTAKGFPLVTSRGMPVIVNQGANEPLLDRFTKLVGPKSGMGTPKARADARAFLDNELGRRFSKSDDLLTMRSALRTRIRAYKTEGTVQASDTAAILSKAEEAVTEALSSQLPKSALATLKAADASYGKYKVFEDAMYRAKDRPGGYTPTQLSMAARDSVSTPGAYARGAGGVPREMASQGVKTFEQRAPATGARQLTMAIPVIRDLLAAPFSAAAATKTGRRLAAGLTPPQRLAKAISDTVGNALTESQKKSLIAAMQSGARTNMLQTSRDQE